MFLLSLLLSTEWSDLELSQERFSDLVAAELEQAAPDCTVASAGPSTLTMSCTEGAERIIYLDSLWAQWQADPQGRETIVATWVSAVSQPADTADAQLDQLMPVVRSQTFLGALAPLGEPLYDPLVGDYVIFYAMDLPDRVQFLSQGDLAELSLTHDALREAAQDNLAALEVEVLGKGPVDAFSAGGTYEASLLALDSLWEGLQTNSGAPIVAVAPTRSVVFFTFSERRRVRRRMQKRAQILYDDGSYVVSPQLIQWTEDGWVTL